MAFKNGQFYEVCNHIELDILLYQTGYLTIKSVKDFADRIYYSLGMPNKEVSIGLND